MPGVFLPVGNYFWICERKIACTAVLPGAGRCGTAQLPRGKPLFSASLHSLNSIQTLSTCKIVRCSILLCVSSAEFIFWALVLCSTNDLTQKGLGIDESIKRCFIQQLLGLYCSLLIMETKLTCRLKIKLKEDFSVNPAIAWNWLHLPHQGTGFLQAWQSSSSYTTLPLFLQSSSLLW